MKATGIVRRMDDLGRIVIPKTVRTSMGLKEGDDFEVYIEEDNTVCFRLYQAESFDWDECIEDVKKMSPRQRGCFLNKVLLELDTKELRDLILPIMRKIN